MRRSWTIFLSIVAIVNAIFLNAIFYIIDNPSFTGLNSKTRLFIIISLTLIFFSTIFYLLSFFQGSVHSAKSLIAIKIDSLASLSECYISFVKKQYSVDLTLMPYEEQVIYVATHYYFLDRKKKLYFPKYKGAEQIAAMSYLGERMIERYHGEWVVTQPDHIPCVSLKQNNDGSIRNVDLFHILPECTIFNPQQNKIAITCFCADEKDKAFMEDLNVQTIINASKKYGLEVFSQLVYPSVLKDDIPPAD